MIFQTDWTYTWQEIRMPSQVVDRGVLITVGEQKKKMLGFFSSEDNGKIVIIPDASDREFVKNKIETLRLASNQ